MYGKENSIIRHLVIYILLKENEIMTKLNSLTLIK